MASFRGCSTTPRKTVLALLVLLLPQVMGSGWLSLTMVNYTNPEGHGSNGNCCDSVISTYCSTNPCDHYFTVCIGSLTSDDTTDSGQCEVMRFETDETEDLNSINFQSNIGNTPNPQSGTFVSWPGSVRMKVDIWDHDDGLFDSDDLVEELRGNFNIVPTVPGQPITPQLLRLKGRTTLHMSLVVRCDVNYYGDSCTTYCHPADDNTNGHYECDDEGKKLCHEGWTGTYCTEDVAECTSDPCQNGGRCVELTGSFVCECQTDYTGKLCETSEGDMTTLASEPPTTLLPPVEPREAMAAIGDPDATQKPIGLDAATAAETLAIKRTTEADTQSTWDVVERQQPSTVAIAEDVTTEDGRVTEEDLPPTSATHTEGETLPPSLDEVASSPAAVLDDIFTTEKPYIPGVTMTMAVAPDQSSSQVEIIEGDTTESPTVTDGNFVSTSFIPLMTRASSSWRQTSSVPAPDEASTSRQSSSISSADESSTSRQSSSVSSADNSLTTTKTSTSAIVARTSACTSPKVPLSTLDDHSAPNLTFTELLDEEMKAEVVKRLTTLFEDLYGHNIRLQANWFTCAVVSKSVSISIVYFDVIDKNNKRLSWDKTMTFLYQDGVSSLEAKMDHKLYQGRANCSTKALSDRNIGQSMSGDSAQMPAGYWAAIMLVAIALVALVIAIAFLAYHKRRQRSSYHVQPMFPSVTAMPATAVNPAYEDRLLPGKDVINIAPMSEYQNESCDDLKECIKV